MSNHEHPLTAPNTAPAARNTKGLSWTHQFTGPHGTSPYAEMDWQTATAVIKDAEGNEIFRQDGVEFPASWGQQAIDIVASKYFYGDNDVGNGTPGPNSEEREWSLVQLIDRVVNTIVEFGCEHDYFADPDDAQAFADDLKWLCANQYGAFNSPVWFNVGLGQAYGLTEDDISNHVWGENFTHEGQAAEGRPIETVDPYLRPQGSACFIIGVDDTLDSIQQCMTESARLFKYGSGVGADWSKLRSTKDKLSGGGQPSGPVSFMRQQDAVGKVIKSGGKCLAPTQKVYTAENGPVEAQELAEQEFTVLSYHPPEGRVKAKRAQAWKSGQKKVVRVTTDKGTFEVSEDHPFNLAGGSGVVRASDLSDGQRLHAHGVHRHNMGYVGVTRGDGSKTLLHRMVAEDVLSLNVNGSSVHHKDGDKLNNAPSNLEIMDQAAHARTHMTALAEAGEHVFQSDEFRQAGHTTGESNGMHRSADFWSDTEKVAAYQKKQAANIQKRDPAKLQKSAVAQRYLNTGWDYINKGYDISTPEKYRDAYYDELGRTHKQNWERRKKGIKKHFGSYDGFLDALDANNHRVLSVESVGDMDVYSVEVFCNTPDDKTPASGHNFLVWPQGNDTRFGTGVFVQNTRRAAIMQTLNDWHPNIEEFVDAKREEEEKAHAMIDGGIDASFNGPAYRTVDFQNVNQSVRVGDAFMEAVKNDEPFELRSPYTDEVLGTINASDLMDRIAENTWACGDPGLQYRDTIDQWHTVPNTAPINSSNPCSEYLHVDNSACNLASLNLKKYKEGDSINTEALIHAAQRFIIAQEILVSLAGYPSEAVAKNSRDLRPLGLGFANAGGLLMSMGLPYDSDEGRALIAAMQAIIHGAATQQSATVAKKLQPFTHYADNETEVFEVVEQHRIAASNLQQQANLSPEWRRTTRDVIDAALTVMDAAYVNAQAHGLRNSQISVIAPTGTIGFYMGAETTGIEPELALVKWKKLAGADEGMMKLVNPLVPEALQALNTKHDEERYDEDTIESIVQYIDKHGTIEGAPGIHEEDLPVFDCSFAPANGERSIAPMGHVKMMAAVQEFVSGAISKTCNVPEDATVEDIRDIYIRAWELGVKAIAIYRENSKRSQPLNTSDDSDDSGEETTEEAAPDPEEAPKVEEFPLAFGQRLRLPHTCAGIRRKIEVAGFEMYLHTGEYPDGSLGEIFLTGNKQGSTLSGLLDSVAVAFSLALQHGTPLQTLVRKYKGNEFAPNGFTGDELAPRVSSIMDYVVRLLEAYYLQQDEEELHVRDADGIAVALSDLYPDDASDGDGVFGMGSPAISGDTDGDAEYTGELCSNCGTPMIPNGSCEACPSCGQTTGC